MVVDTSNRDDPIVFGGLINADIIVCVLQLSTAYPALHGELAKHTARVDGFTNRVTM